MEKPPIAGKAYPQSPLYRLGGFRSCKYVSPDFMQQFSHTRSFAIKPPGLRSYSVTESTSQRRPKSRESTKPHTDSPTIYIAVYAHMRPADYKLLYPCHYSQLFALALMGGLERFKQQLCRCFRLLKRTMPRINYETLQLEVRPRSQQRAGSILQNLANCTDRTAITIEELIESERNSYRAVFGGLKEYNQLLVVKWMNNPAEYMLYQQPAVYIFQNMLNQKLIGQFDYTNRNPECMQSLLRNMERLTNGYEYFKYPFTK